MKKILFIVNDDTVIFNQRLEIVKELLIQGYEVWFTCPKGNRTDEMVEMGCKFVPSILSRHGKNPFQDIKLYKTYKKIIKDVKPDCVLTFTIKPNIYGAMASKKLNVPCIANITGLGTAVENKGILQKITTMLYKKAFKKIKRVFFQNTENMQFFVDKKIAIEKHKLIPGSGVNLQKFKILPYSEESGEIEFAFIARIMKEKGIDNYLDAAKFITEKYPFTKFHICGFIEDEYKGKMQEYINKDIVIYHGLVRDMVEIYKQINCTIHPTYYPEGMSNVLLESCASGRPIITTDRSGCREIVEDGKNGYIIKQEDSQDLIEKIEKFLALSMEERKQMGICGRAKVEKEFDRQIVVDAYMKEINSL